MSGAFRFREAASTCVEHTPDQPAARDVHVGDDCEALAAFLEAAAVHEAGDGRGAEEAVAEDGEESSIVDMFGQVADRTGVRAQLVRFYESTRQLTGPADEHKDQHAAAVTEMTLRVDTELELLRRRCFAERNARWGFSTPSDVAFSPAIQPVWASQPANYKLALQAAEAASKGGKAALLLQPTAASPPVLDGFPVSERALDPVWPPGEFSARPPARPKARGGKRKATPAAIIAARSQASTSIYPRMCVDCRSQTTPLWRKRAVKPPHESVKEQTAVLEGTQAVSGANNGAEQPAVEEQEDVCLLCFLKSERRDLFGRKKAEKARKERERRDRAAAEKKRLQQLKKQHKKQQEQLKKVVADTDAKSKPVETAAVADSTPSEPPTLLKFSKDELDEALERNAAKKERKRSHHDKKKKKKKKKKRRLEHYADSDSDGPTPMPSPPQMARFDYADLSRSETREDIQPASEAPEQLEQPVVDREAGRHASRSSRKRESKTKSPSRAASKKRRSVDVAAEPVPVVVAPPVSASSSRPSRAKAAASVAVPVAVPPTPTPKRKRSRAKKEASRDRELRALGQYCPVCNEVYEEDDDSSFVCCDSCEMWVHAACDQGLTPEAVTALANPDEKYICPLCAGR